MTTGSILDGFQMTTDSISDSSPTTIKEDQTLDNYFPTAIKEQALDNHFLLAHLMEVVLVGEEVQTI
jgi:hypothetical protein